VAVSNIAKIVANIEYIHPEGELERYKYGVKINPPTVAAKVSQEVVELNPKALRQELSKPALRPKADFELTGTDVK
jgi:hypothetical protein